MVILLLARHRELGLFRVHALEGAGHDVIFPQHKQAALEVIVRGNFDLIVLSYSLSSDTAQELVEIARQKYPDRPVIAISESGWEDTKLRPDATVLAGDGPDGMLDAIARVTRQGFRRVK
jgi:CheY-like chemotaxis protein